MDPPVAAPAAGSRLVFYGSLAVDERAALDAVRAPEDGLARRLGCSPLACAFVAALAGTFDAHSSASKIQLEVHVENTNIYLSAYSDAPAEVPVDSVSGLYGFAAAAGAINAAAGALLPAAVQSADVSEWRLHTFCRVDGAAEVPKLTAPLAPHSGWRQSGAHRKAATEVIKGLWDAAYQAFWSTVCPAEPVAVQFKLLDEPLMRLTVLPWTTGRRMVASGGPLIIEVTGASSCVACTQFEAGLDGLTDHIILRNFDGVDKKASASEAVAAGGCVKWRPQVGAVKAQTFSPSRPAEVPAAPTKPVAPKRPAPLGRRKEASDLYEELGDGEAGEDDTDGGGRFKRRRLTSGAAAAGRYSPAYSPKELGVRVGRRTPLMRLPTPSEGLKANYELDPMPPAFLDPWLEAFAKAQVSTGILGGLPAEYKGAIADPPLEQLRLAFPDYAAHREDFEPSASDATAIRVVNAIAAFVVSSLRANGARALVPERWTTGFFSEAPFGLPAGRATVTTAEWMAAGDAIWPTVASGVSHISGSRVHQPCELFELARGTETDGTAVAILGFNLAHPIWTNLTPVSVCCRVKPAVANAVLTMIRSLAGGADLGSAACCVAYLDECLAEKFVAPLDSPPAGAESPFVAAPFAGLPSAALPAALPSAFAGLPSAAPFAAALPAALPPTHVVVPAVW